jgi:hypothetical protein
LPTFLTRSGFLILCLIWLGTAWWARVHYLPYDVNNTDVGTYLFQAQTFADGHLWRSTPEPREFFQQWQAVVRDRSYAYYPPGHALLLAVPLALKFNPWIVPWLLSGLSLCFLYAWTKTLAGSRSALLAIGVTICSPFFAANSASLLSHSTTLFLTVLFLWSSTKWAEDQRRFSAIITGISLAWIFSTRPVNAVALGIVWIPWIFLMHQFTTSYDLLIRRKTLAQSWGFFFLGIFTILAPVLTYYRTLGGRWRLDLFTDYWPRNRFGFGTDLGRGEPGHFFQTTTNHDFWGMVNNWKYSFPSLSEWWTGNVWLSWILLLLLVGFLIHRLVQFFRTSKTPTLHSFASTPQPHLLLSSSTVMSSPTAAFSTIPLIAWPFVHILLYSFYYTPSTPFSGPRYLTELIPVLAVATGWTLSRLFSFRIGGIISCLLMITILFISTSFKKVFYNFNASGIPARRLVEQTPQQANLPALVFIRSFWLGHPYPIFLNRTDMKDPILYACDRGEENKRLVEQYPDRNAYVLAVTVLPNNKIQSELIQIYDAKEHRWVKEPGEVIAPFFIGSKFTPPIQIKGENSRRLFFPKPEEIEPQ